MTADIDRPIFIVAPHRSGTTLLYEVIGRHRDVGFFNRFNKRFPSSPRLAGWLTRWSGHDQPMEAQRIWDRFKSADHDRMGAADLSVRVRDWYRGAVDKVLRNRGATRFVAKYPRLSLRLPWLNELFPTARFVHLTRDWRAVVSSTVERRVKRKKRGGGWFGVYPEDWRKLEDLPDAVVATRLYIEATRSIEKAAVELSGRFLQLSYEEICEKPLETIRLLCHQLDLDWSSTFEATIPRSLHSGNWKWPRTLSPEEVESLRQEDPDLLSRYESNSPTSIRRETSTG